MFAEDDDFAWRGDHEWRCHWGGRFSRRGTHFGGGCQGQWLFGEVRLLTRGHDRYLDGVDVGAWTLVLMPEA